MVWDFDRENYNLKLAAEIGLTLMKLPSHQLLRFMTKNREVSLADLAPFIDDKFEDYRDYYPLAQLCTAEYIKCEWSIKGEPCRDEKTLASIFYSEVTGEKKVNSFTRSKTEITPEIYKFYSTPKAELYLAEFAAKRSDRIYAMAVGIIVGICTAILTVKLNLK